MRIVLDGVAKGDALPATSLAFESGLVTVVGVETAQRPTVLGLVASGRMRAEGGSVTVDGAADLRRIRRSIALVDAPVVSEPNESVTLAGVTAEELMFAGRPANPWAVMRVLTDLGADTLARAAMADIPPGIRFRVQLELALLRPGVTGIVWVSPDRHGGDPDEWAALAREIAGRDIAVLVIVGLASADVDTTLANEPAESADLAESVELVELAGPADAPEPRSAIEPGPEPLLEVEPATAASPLISTSADGAPITALIEPAATEIAAAEKKIS